MNESKPKITKEVAERHRIKIECTKEGLRLLDDLKERSGSSTRAELIRKAINALEFALDAKARGRRIATVDENGKIEYVHLWL